MKTITENIDAQLQVTIDLRSCKWFGLAELMTKGTQVQPVTINGRKQVSIDDKFDAIVYHRALSIENEDNEEFSFGRNMAMTNRLRLRTVLAFKVARFTEELIYTFLDALPQTIEVTGYDIFDLNSAKTVIVDQEGVYKQEFGGGDYEKHIATWNIYAIEYDVDFITCNTTSVCL